MFILAACLVLLSQTPQPPNTGHELLKLPLGAELSWWGPWREMPQPPVFVVLEGFERGENTFAFSEDSYRFDLTGAQPQSRYIENSPQTWRLQAGSPNGRFVARIQGQEITRLDAGDGSTSLRLTTFLPTSSAPAQLAVRDDGAVSVASEAGSIYLWIEGTPQLVWQRVLDTVGGEAEVDGIRWLGDSDELFVLPVEGHPLVRNVFTGRRIGVIEIDFPDTQMIAHHPGRDTLLIGGGDRTLREYTRDLEPVGSMEFPGEPLIHALPFGPSRVLVHTNYTHIVRALDLETWTVLWERDLRCAYDFSVHEGRASFLARCSEWVEERSLEDGRLLSRVVFYEGGAWLREVEDGVLTCSPGLDLEVELSDGRKVRTPSLVSKPESK